MLITALTGVPFLGAVTLQVSGEIDEPEKDELLDSIVACADDQTMTVVLDFSEVTFMGSSGLRAVIRAHKVLEERQCRLCIDDCSSIVERVLTIAGLRNHFARSIDSLVVD